MRAIIISFFRETGPDLSSDECSGISVQLSGGKNARDQAHNGIGAGTRDGVSDIDAYR
jgi:hypothetical protein